MAKQAELSKLVTELQRGRMDSLVTWMGKAEAIWASLAEPPGSREELAEQCGRKESLLEQLEEQQATVSSISHFILVESEETRGLEEELALLGERWHGLCRGCEARHAHMEMLASLWTEVNSQGEELARWMADVELKLRKMELEEVEGERLQEQERQVRVSTQDKHDIWWLYITMWKRLEQAVVQSGKLLSQLSVLPIIGGISKTSQDACNHLVVHTLQPACVIFIVVIINV